MLMGLQYERLRLNGHQRSTLTFETYLLGLTYQVRIMTLASTVLKKSSFQKISHLNALGSKLDLDVK